MNVFQAATASAIHRAVKRLEWEDGGVFRRQVKHYSAIVALLTKEEAERSTGRSYSDDIYYTIDFSGDLPHEVRNRIKHYMRGMDRLAPQIQQLLQASFARLVKNPLGPDGLWNTLHDWKIGTEDWTPL